MDDQQDNVPPQCNEAWFDVAIPRGREFQLPSISSPINPPWIETGNNLFISEYQQLDPPAITDNAFVSNLSNPSSAGNQLSSLPIMETAPPIATTITTVDRPENSLSSTRNSSVELNLFVPIGNHHIHFPRSITLPGSESHGPFPVRNQFAHFPSSAIPSWNGLNVSFLPRNQNSHVVNSSNSPCYSSTDSLNFGNYPTYAHTSRYGSNICTPTGSQIIHIPTPPNMSRFHSNDCITSNHVHIPSSGSTSSIDFPSTRNQHIRSISFADLPFVVSNDSLTMRNQPAHAPMMIGIPGVSANGSHLQNGPNSLHDSSHLTRIRSNVSSPMRNQSGNATCTPQSHCSGSVSSPQAFGPSSLQVGQSSSHVSQHYYDEKLICKECDEEFPSYNALRGHMSFHARARKMDEKVTSLLDASHLDSPVVPPEYKDGCLGPTPTLPTVSGYLLGVTNDKVEGNNSHNKEKERLRSPSAEENTMEKLSEISKKDGHQSCKRIREEGFPPNDFVEDRFDPRHKVLKKEPSSLDEPVENKYPKMVDAVQHSPTK